MSARRDVAMILATAILGSLIGLWISPGRAYSAELAPAGITLDAHRVVLSSTLPSCTFEDGSRSVRPCTWNVNAHDGNGRGLAYWIGRAGRIHYVWAHSPIRHGWEWISPADAHAMSSARDWTTCAVRFGDRRTVVKCADGYRYSDATRGAR